MTPIPPNDKAMPSIVMATKDLSFYAYDERIHDENSSSLTKYVRADLQAERIKRLEDALTSIAKNTCCGGCQEAAKVARAVLDEGGK